ncbi:MAG TPA: hypothetical protein VFF98_00785 [Novosphingobium sp.]|nr:hypothetical protein [Novosphingobium sp.]
MLFKRKGQFWDDVSLSGFIGDFLTVFRQAGRLRWRISALAVACTYAVFSLIIHDEHRIEPRLPTITYITSWEDGRTDAEILAGNRANQRRKEAEAAREAAADADVKGMYKAVGRASGLDVDQMERQAKADAAKDAAAAKAKQAALYGAGHTATP